MDANLEKIRDSHLYDIRNGDIKIVLRQAEHYLGYVHGWDRGAARREMNSFKRHIKEIASRD